VVDAIASMLWVRGMGNRAGGVNAARAIVDELDKHGLLMLDDERALARARDAHERHVDLLAGCPLCELEAGHQRDRLACDVCGEPLRPDEPFDGHPECREQE
jgi:hypothetical protein